MVQPYYESERALSEYLLFHYGRDDEVLPWKFGPREACHYPVRCVTELLEVSRVPSPSRALDLGCAVGRSSFELARHCQEVVGIDFSSPFIAAAHRLQEQGSLPYQYFEEGDLTIPAVASVSPDIDRTRVAFEQGDAQDLRSGLGQFDVVLLANLLDRLPEPRRCLNALPEHVRPGGQLLITTPCTWLVEYTPRPHWLGGRVQDGRSLHTLDSLSEILGPAFELSETRDVPFLIREHARKYQWSVALGTRWVRR